MVAITVFVLALILKPDYALLIGVLISLVLFLWKTMHPRIVRIARDPERDVFRNADRAQLPGCPQILHLRSDNVIYFGNAEYTIERILERVDEADRPLKFLLLDFSAVGFIDVTGIDELKALLDELELRGIRLGLIDVHLPVRDAFERAGLMEQIARTCRAGTLGCLLEGKGEAIAKMFGELDHDYCRDVCPYRLYDECSTVK
jgi:SulP family sulfate permease